MAAEFPDDQSNTMVARVKRLLLSPASEWAAINSTPMTTGEIFTGWVLPLAAIGPIAQFIGSTVFGYDFLGFSYRPSLMFSLATAVIGYVVALVGVWVIALVINGLAPSFGGTKNQGQAMKVAAFSMTASWLAGIFGILPALSILALTGLYSLYLLYVGLPMLMKVGAEKALPYTVAAILVSVVVLVIGSAVATSVAGRVMMPMASLSSPGGGQISGSVNLPNGASVDMGKLNDAAQRMKAAGEAMKTGQAAPAIPGQALQDMLPASIGGWNRTEIENQSGGAAGISGSHAEARYQSGDQSFRLSVTDTGALGTLAALGGALNAQSSRQTETGYEKAAMVDGRMTNEKWDNSSKSGSFGVMVGSRFMVEAEGSAPSADTLKGAVATIDFARLETLAK
ncbi:MAG: Yip1 family protein [Sphingomonas sp.]|jgi:hypothetical protein